jgi:hypothetical protein
MSAAGRAAGALLRLASAPRAAAFQRALDDPAAAQRRVLARLAGLGIEEFRERVPVSDYAALEPRIERLAPGRVRCYESTSGSSGTPKRIPYNDALLASFRSLFAIWAHDLLTHALRPRSGRTFISLSSPIRGPSGFADDRDYLGGLSRALIGRFLVTPPRFAAGQTPEAWRDALARALLACRDLEVISVWNPSYFLILLEHIEERHGAMDWKRVWPALQLVSCWRDGAAAAPAARLAALLPHARLQGKGLVATEAPVTVPLEEAGGCVPLVDEVFLELEDERGLILLHEARPGAVYELVLSQAGGLLRYRLGDRVRVAGTYRGTPMLAFAGRAGAVSDLVGEKLDEAQVSRALEALAPGSFCTLLPVLPEEGRAHYRLLTDDARPDLAAALDAALMQAFRYREARLLGQLEAVRSTSRADMRRAVHDALVDAGMKAGDIKDRALIASLELARRIAPRCTA